MLVEKITVELDDTGVLGVDANLADTPFLQRISADIVRLHEKILKIQQETRQAAAPTAA